MTTKSERGKLSGLFDRPILLPPPPRDGARRPRMRNRVIDRGRTPIGERAPFLSRPDQLRALLGSVSPMGFFATKPELVALGRGSDGDRAAKEESP